MTLPILNNLPAVGNRPIFEEAGLLSLDSMATECQCSVDMLTLPYGEYQDWLQAENERRLDACDAAAEGVGLYLAEELRLVLAEVLTEERPPMSMLDAIPRDTQVNGDGFREWIQYKVEHVGKAGYADGNPRDIPTVDVGHRKETGKIYPFVTGFKMSIWDMAAAQRASFMLRSNLSAAVNEVMPRFVNDQIVSGSENPRVFGLNNHPFLGRTVLPGTIGVSTAPETIEANLHAMANLRAEESKTRFAPNVIRMGTKAVNYLANKKLNTAGGQVSILQSFLDSNRYINSVEEAPELDDFMGTGLGLMLFHREGDSRSLSYIQPYLPRLLPVQIQGFNQSYYLHSMYGGLRSRTPLDVLLTFYTFG